MAQGSDDTLSRLLAAIKCDPDSPTTIKHHPWTLAAPFAGTVACDGVLLVAVSRDMGHPPLSETHAIATAKLLASDTPPAVAGTVAVATLKAWAGAHEAGRPCGDCAGVGRVTCRECRGKGRTVCYACDQDCECELCDSDGKADCYRCHGAKVITDDLIRPGRVGRAVFDRNRLAVATAAMPDDLPPVAVAVASVPTVDGWAGFDVLRLTGEGWAVVLREIECGVKDREAAPVLEVMPAPAPAEGRDNG